MPDAADRQTSSITNIHSIPLRQCGPPRLTLGDRPTAGLRALNPPIQVRILVPQPDVVSCDRIFENSTGLGCYATSVSASSRGAPTTTLRYSALAQRQCTGLLRQGIQVRILGAEPLRLRASRSPRDPKASLRGCLTGSGRCLASSRIGVQLSTAPPSGPSARCAACPLLPRVSSNGKTPVFQTGDGGSIPSARTYGTAQVVEQEYTPVSETGSARTCRFDPGPEHRRQRTTKEWKAKSGWSRRSTANRVAPTTLWFDSSAFRHRSRGARCAAWLGTRTRWVRFPGLRP